MVTMITDSVDSPIIRRRMSRSIVRPSSTPLPMPTSRASGQGSPQVLLAL